MSHKDGVMVYELRKPIKYSKNGAFEDVLFIELYEFGAAHTRQYFKLKQFVDKAIFDAQKLAGDRPEQGDVASGDGAIQQGQALHEVKEQDHADNANDLADLLNISMSLSDDEDRVCKFVDAFRAMVLHSSSNPIAKLNGDTILNENHWKEIHPEEQQSIATRYCAFFGIGLLGQMKEESATASEQPTEVKAL